MASDEVNVFPAKVWADPVETLDYADLDAAGQPLFALFSNAIGATQVDADSMVDKIEGLGGPAYRASFVFPANIDIQAGFQLPVGQLTIKGVTTGAITHCSGVLGTPFVFVAVAGAHG